MQIVESLKQLRSLKIVVPCALLVTLFCFGSTILAAGDVVDAAFNPQVQTTTLLNKSIDQIVPLADGKMFVSGHFNSYNGQPVGGLVRLNADGSLDSTFDNNLIVPGTFPRFIIPRSDGKFYIVDSFSLTNETNPAARKILRLNADGTIDSSFDFKKSGFFYSAGLDASGRLLVSGSFEIDAGGGNTVNRRMLRINEDGTIDSSFVVNIAVDKFTVQNNKVVFGEYDRNLEEHRLYRLNEDGTPDSSFAVTPLGKYHIVDIKVQNDKKILVLTNDRLLRLNENGEKDDGFQVSAIANPIRTVLQNDGKITVASGNNTADGYKFVRFLPNGTQDTSFGLYTYKYLLGGFAVFQDGGIAVGDQNSGRTNNFVRLLPSGEVDASFNSGGSGFQFVKPGRIRVISVLPDNRILIGGDFDKVNQIARSRIARLNSDGTPDASFQINTSGTGDYFSQFIDVYSFAIQDNGKIIVSGNFTYYQNGVQKRNIVRLDSGGNIDATFNISIYVPNNFDASGFGQNKIVQTADGRLRIGTTRAGLNDNTPVPLGLLSDGSADNSFAPDIYKQKNLVIGYDIAVQPDGKILLAGRWTISDVAGDTDKGFIVRLNRDGSVDTTFQPTEISGREITALKLLANGQILIVSRSRTSTQESIVYRLNSGGSVDDSFVSESGANGRINAIETTPSGNIVVGGSFTTFNGEARRNFALLNPNGELEPTSVSINSEVLTITVDSQGRILLGGEFTFIKENGQAAVERSYVARLNDLERNLKSAILDFDGDGKTDISVFRPSAGEWYYLRSSDGKDRGFRFGSNEDKPVSADYTGDGKADIAFYRPSSGEWFIIRSEDSSFYSFPFGAIGDIPAPGDFDGDGKADAAVFRPSSATWYINNSSGGVTIKSFGRSGDVPTVADYDGDGKADVAIYRPGVSEWWIDQSQKGSVTYQFGTNGDIPVQADYTGDGKTDVAVWRSSTGTWYILRSENSSFYAAPFGISTDLPIVGDFDGDGKSDFSVFRPSEGTWYINRTNSGMQILKFGTAADKPLPAKYLP